MSGSDDVPQRGSQSLWSEDNLAERVRLEREARGWSTGTLAEKMSAAGFPVNQSAIWRIESAEPRRRINLDEAIGFAEVFDIPLENLLGPPQLAMHARVKELIEDIRQRQREYLRASAAIIAARDEFDAYLDQHPEVRDEAEAAVGQAMADDAIAGHYPGPVLVTLEPDDANPQP
jgi:transcriptional regulator with XRE-family HTH domain